MKRNVQHFLCVTDGDWKMARKQKESPLHILEPVDLKVIFSRAMVVKDSRMAKSVCVLFFFINPVILFPILEEKIVDRLKLKVVLLCVSLCVSMFAYVFQVQDVWRASSVVSSYF